MGERTVPRKLSLATTIILVAMTTMMAMVSTMTTMIPFAFAVTVIGGDKVRNRDIVIDGAIQVNIGHADSLLRRKLEDPEGEETNGYGNDDGEDDERGDDDAAEEEKTTL